MSSVPYSGATRRPAGRALQHRKYLRINSNEFLFDFVQDQRERASLAERHPEVLQRLKGAWGRWNVSMLPITEDVRSHGVDGTVQADRYHAGAAG